jgi:hypothetical protein
MNNIMFYGSIFCIISFIFLLIASEYGPKTCNEPFYNYDWSTNWSKYDKQARAGADCNPVYRIQRKMGTISTWIWIMPKSCEQGLPHTRSIDVIAMPENLPESKIAEILDHEKIHLLQRRMPESWARFYRIKWDYDLYNEPPIGMPDNLKTMIRANPDTAASPWCCWRKRWWPVPVYKLGAKLSLGNSQVKWWDQQKGTVTSNPPDAWTEFFGVHIHQAEHPHEITAEYLSGPLANGAIPANASTAMVRLHKSWIGDDPLFPTVD